MNRKQRLELIWVGKDERPRLEPRILLEDPALSYHAARRVSPDDRFDNILIHGDNLLALKALEPDFRGTIKCVYVDPPFNTHQDLFYYEDGMEHSRWLSLMRDRFELLHSLLRSDGTLFAHIGDSELGYLIAILDEIFGRRNRKAVVTFKQGAPTGHKAINPGVVNTTNFLLVYARDDASWRPKRVFVGRVERDRRYTKWLANPGDPPEQWSTGSLSDAFANKLGVAARELKKRLAADYERLITEFVHKNAERVLRLARPDYDAIGAAAREAVDMSSNDRSRVYVLERENHPTMYFLGGERILFYSDKLRVVDGEVVAGEPLTSLWDDLLSNNLHNEGGVSFPRSKKPEALIKRCLELSSDVDDWILDSFAGSGTTGAVAHKMRRRWIMAELGDHCRTHIVPRMQAVVEGRDESGVTKAVAWKGGGGFRYYRLAPTLMKQDAFGNLVINPAYNPEMLAQAVCQLMGFRYAPSEQHYWQHGRATERDFIYVTTTSLTHAQLRAISEDVGSARSLLVCCKAFDADPDAFENLTIKKIPQAVLAKCEWGRDDYSLRVADLPDAAPAGAIAVGTAESATDAAAPRAAARPARRTSTEPVAMRPKGGLFDEPDA